MVLKLHPGVRGIVPKLEESRVFDYPDIVKRSLSSVSKFEYISDVKIKLGQIPEKILADCVLAVDEKFVGLVPLPGESNIGGTERIKTTHREISEKIVERSEIDGLSIDGLDLLNDENHLLSYFERQIRSCYGETGSIPIFKDRKKEAMYARHIYDKLREFGMFKESSIKEWIHWSIGKTNFLSEVRSSDCGLQKLLASWTEFRAHMTLRDTLGSEPGDIYGDLDNIFSQKDDMIQYSLLKYGFLISYFFLSKSNGDEEATRRIEMFLSDLEDGISEKENKELFTEIVKRTYEYGAKEKYPLPSEIRVRIAKMNKRIPKQYKETYKSNANKSVSNQFWEQIEVRNG
jgi:hypothetical protein